MLSFSDKKKLDLAMEVFFYVTTINYSFKKGGEMARSQLGFKVVGAYVHFNI